MTIPSVMRGLIETEDGKVFELDSPKGAVWLDSIGSFRYEPTGDGKPYTVRKEGKNGEYWYGCRKIEGKVRKKYIGKSSEVSVAKLEEIAEALEIPAEPRVNKVAEVVQAPQVVERVTESRVTVLELQVAELLKAVEALQEALPGKSDAGNSVELPKVDNEVTEQLHNELGNLKAENEALRQELEKAKYDYNTLIIISQQLNQQLEEVTADRAKLLEEVQEVRSQLETEKIRYKELDEEFWDMEGTLNQTRAELVDRGTELAELRSELSTPKKELAAVPTENPEPEKKSAPGVEFPEAAELLNQLKPKMKAKGKKSTASLADVESILEILEES